MFVNLFTSPKIIRIDNEYAIHLCPICGFEQVETKMFDDTTDLGIVENEKVTSPNICQNCQDEHPDTICAISAVDLILMVCLASVIR